MIELATIVLAGATHAASVRFPAFQGWLRVSSAVVSIFFGAVIAWRTLTAIGVLPGGGTAAH